MEHLSSDMDPALLCKVFFTTGTSVVLGGTLIPSFRQYVMNYGPRSLGSSPAAGECTKNQKLLTKLFQIVASYQVPHAWFIHYYVVSVASSVFWGLQICTHGNALAYLASQSQPSKSGMTVNQVFLALLFMAVQGARRLYECTTLTNPSQSKMWVGLWLVGIAYYICMGISVWIEGIAAINVSRPMTLLDISKPSIKTFVAVPIFILASIVQHDTHKYLAGLKKYTLPVNYWFKLILCPHYTSECLIYASIAIVSAPKGQIINRTVLAGLGFVFSNLAVTADSTKNWYAAKFGKENLGYRWRMIPYVY